MRILSFLAALLLVTSAVATETEPETLSWEDLKPEGEDEALQEQYNAYIAGLEEQLGSGQGQSLFDAAPGRGPAGIAEGSAFDTIPQLGSFNVVEDLDGARIRIPGFVLPFEYSASGEVTEFLLVPYFGACIHTPPPPPNQIVYVKSQRPLALGKQWAPIWATGVMRTTSKINELGDAAYTLEIESWEGYGG